MANGKLTRMSVNPSFILIIMIWGFDRVVKQVNVNKLAP